MPGNENAKKIFVIAVLIVLFITILAVAAVLNKSAKDKYSVGYQIAPHYLGTSTWAGDSYALTPSRESQPACRSPAVVRKDRFQPFAAPDDGPRGTTDPPALIYTPPFTSDLRGSHPNWWRSDGGTYGLPVAADRPDFWAGDATIHTYLARDPIPQLCNPSEVVDHQRRLEPGEWTQTWQYYGGPKGWNMSPYY